MHSTTRIRPRYIVGVSETPPGAQAADLFNLRKKKKERGTLVNVLCFFFFFFPFPFGLPKTIDPFAAGLHTNFVPHYVYYDLCFAIVFAEFY